MAKQENRNVNPTRRQRARSRKQREQLNRLYLGLGVVAALIALVLAFGAIQEFVIDPGRVVLSVNGTEITKGEYQDRVFYERYLLEEQIEQIQTAAQEALATAGENPDDQLTQAILGQYNQFLQILGQQREEIDAEVFDILQDEELIKTEAEARGITVSEAEITEEINRTLASRLEGYTAAAAQETATAIFEATATAELFTPTPTLEPTAEPTEEASEEATAEPTPADTPTPAPTPTLVIINEETLGGEYTEWIQTLTTETGLTESQYREIIRVQLLQEKLQEAIGDEVPREAEQANARHILFATNSEEEAEMQEEAARNALAQLEAEEADFATLAEELSDDPGSAAQGGDLGFVPRGQFVEPVEEFIFEQPVGEVGLVESQFGWHVIEVLAREERELAPAQYQQAQQEAYQEWLNSARANANIEGEWTVDLAPRDLLLE